MAFGHELLKPGLVKGQCVLHEGLSSSSMKQGDEIKQISKGKALFLSAIKIIYDPVQRETMEYALQRKDKAGLNSPFWDSLFYVIIFHLLYFICTLF